MNAETAVGICFRLVFWVILVFCKGFWIVLFCICCFGGGIQPDERGVDDTKLSELAHLRFHNIFQNIVIKLPNKTAKRPIRRQGFPNIEATIMGDEKIIVQIVP